jgi:glutaredoxin
MYTLSTCPWCRKAKKYFADRDVPVTCTDYDLVDDAEQERIMNDMLEHGGSGQFPYVRIGNEVIVGWNPEKYAELLEQET